MADFYVDIPALNPFSGAVGRVAEDARAGQKHLQQYANIGATQEGLLLSLLAPHSHAREIVRRALNVTTDRGDAVAGAIREAAFAYDRTDDAARREFDARLPGARFGLEESLRPFRAPSGVRFADANEPTRHFVQPPPPDGGPLFEFTPLDVISPTAYIRKALVEIVGYDPWERWTAWTSGDWKAYHRCSTAWQQFAAAFEDMGRNLGKVTADSEFGWRGNAADRCREYLVWLANALIRMREPCQTLSQKYQEAVDAAKAFNEFAAGIAGGMTDAVAMWILMRQLAASSHSGPIARRWLRSMIVFYASQVLELVKQLIDAYNNLLSKYNVISGVINGLSAGDLTEAKAQVPQPFRWPPL